MADGGDGAKGFKRTSGLTGDHYLYDLNGNMTQDKHKNFSLSYNYLNLPQSFTQGANAITMTYTADGEKLTKALTGGGATKNYVGGIEYSGANLEAIYFSEGRCTPNGATAFFYEYTIKDHLGNARVSFRAITNGTAIQPLQENHYYPFGMEMEGTWLAQVGTENQYEYNGKELNEDFGLGLYDYGARWYDAAIGRWGQIDPMAEDISQISISPYHYTFNNPISFFDPDGMQGTNEYVRDYVTGETVQVGDKGGDEVDYIYNGTIKKDGEGNVEGVNYTEYGAVVMNVEKMHSFDAGGGGFTEVIREPGLLATVYHAPASGGIESTEDPITIFAGGWVRAGVRGLSTAMGTTVTRGTAVALEGQVAKTSSNILHNTSRQLQAKFKHAADFGVLGNYSKANASKFSSAINQHINSAGVLTINGTYRGKSVIHFLNPNTGLNVISSPTGQFISCWKLNSTQLQNVLIHGGL